jgi:hypothetical protein
MGLASFSLLVAAWVSSYLAGRATAEAYKTSERLTGRATVVAYVLLLALFFLLNVTFTLSPLSTVALVCAWCFLAALL